MCAEDLMTRNENEKIATTTAMLNSTHALMLMRNEAEQKNSPNQFTPLRLRCHAGDLICERMWVCMCPGPSGALHFVGICLWRYHTRTHSYLLTAFGQHMCTKCKHQIFNSRYLCTLHVFIAFYAYICVYVHAYLPTLQLIRS